MEAWWHSSASYKGVAVNVSASNVPQGATQVRVTTHRAAGGDVVKTSKVTGSVIASITSGGQVTMPVVIQAGTYDEAASSSWNAPVAVWTPQSVPTSVTVDLLAGTDVVATAALAISPYGGVTADHVMPVTTPPLVVKIPSGGQSFVVDVPAEAETATLELGNPSGPDKSVVVPVEVVVQTSLGVSVVIPANTTVTSSDPAWDGTLQLPKLVTDVRIPASSGQTTTLGVAIELGSPTARIDFDSPVSVVLEGQAGKRAGYVQDGSFHAIDTECPAAGPAHMTTDECWMNDGDDLVIWTTHFTTFLSYTTAAAGSGSAAARLADSGAPDLSVLTFLALGVAGLGVVLLVGSRRRALRP